MVISALPDQGERVLKIKQDRTESLNRFLLNSNPPLLFVRGCQLIWVFFWFFHGVQSVEVGPEALPTCTRGQEMGVLGGPPVAGFRRRALQPKALRMLKFFRWFYHLKNKL